MKDRQLVHRLLDEMLNLLEADPLHQHSDVTLKLEAFAVDMGESETREDLTTLAAEIVTDIDDVASVEEFTRTDTVMVNGGEKSNNVQEYDTTRLEEQMPQIAYVRLTNAERYEYPEGIHEALCKAIHEGDEDNWDLLRQNVEDIGVL